LKYSIALIIALCLIAATLFPFEKFFPLESGGEPEDVNIGAASDASHGEKNRTGNDSKKSEQRIIYYYDTDDVEMVAKVLYNECRGISSMTEQACVVWIICNRVDAGYGDIIADVVTPPKQFAYWYNTPVWDELYILAEDVLERWNREQNGETDVGRVLPPEYLWFTGDGRHNYFRDTFRNGTRWDYSLPSPYES
jgi:hypothetical protein